jgi:hypothetical protein
VRPPVLLAGDLKGLAIPDARLTRVAIDAAGALTIVRRGRPPEVVAEAGTIDRITPIDAAHLRQRRFVPRVHVGLVVFWSGERPVAAISWSQIWASSSNLFRAEVQRACGLEAVAAALGTVIDAPTDSDLRLARTWDQRDVLTLVDPVVLPARWASSRMALVMVLAFVGMPATGRWWVVLPALALLTPAVMSFHRRRNEFYRLVTTPLDPAGRVAVRPRPPLPTSRMVTINELQVGADDVVLRTEVSEWWLLGPSRDGVRALDVHPERWVFRDVGDRQVLTLSPEAWGDVLPELEHAASQAGIEVRHHPEPFVGPARVDGPRPGTARFYPDDDDVENGDGGANVAAFRHVAVFFVLLASLLSVTRYEWWAIPIVLWALLLVALSVRGVGLHVRWVQNLRRRITV